LRGTPPLFFSEYSPVFVSRIKIRFKSTILLILQTSARARYQPPTHPQSVPRL
jgi:hypothetical protein